MSENNRFEDWFNTAQTPPEKTESKKQISIKPWLACVLCAVLILVGYVLGFASSWAGNSTGDDFYKTILSEVMRYMDTQSLYQMSDEEWNDALANGGTAMLQTVDHYGFLLSPEQWYELYYGTTESQDTPIFGFAFTQMQGVGLLIEEVVTDSPAYGRIFVGEYITDVKVNATTGYLLPSGKYLDVKFDDMEQISLALSQANYLVFEISYYDVATRQMVVRDQVNLTKGRVSNPNNSQNFQFVEYYYGIKNGQYNTNVSTVGRYSTRSLRGLHVLDNTPIGYIRITSFEDTILSDGTITSAENEFKEALIDFKLSGKTKLILDLKGNPGGYVDSAVAIAQHLVYSEEEGRLPITTLKNRDDRILSNHYLDETYYADYFSTDLTEKSIVVLTDGGSASASELLTGALLDYGTAVQMGTTTFGKGIAQYCVPLERYPVTITVDGERVTSYYAIYFTVAKYYLPKGANIHEVGLTPDQQYQADDYETLFDMAIDYLT